MDEGEQVEENIDSDEENCSKDEQDVGQQPSSSKKARKSYSKLTKVTYGEDGCVAKPMLLQNLKDHAKAKHGSSHPKIKGQPTVASMFLGGKERRKTRGPDCGVGTLGILERTENSAGNLELIGVEDVDTNQSLPQKESEDQSRKKCLTVARNEFDIGPISAESLNQITKFELLFLYFLC